VSVKEPSYAVKRGNG